MWTLRNLFALFFITLELKVWAGGGEVILVSHNHGVALLHVDSGRNTSVVSSDRAVVAFDIHYSWNQLFWATDYTIYRTPLYDTGTVTPLAEVGRVGGLAVDWVRHRLYWTDLGGPGEARVEVARLDGTGRRVVARGGRAHVGAMALDPLLGKLFWIEWDGTKNNETRIMTCNLDGSGKRTFHKSDSISRESPLAIDVTVNGIYFYKVTSNGSELWDANYDVPVDGTKLVERHENPPKTLCLAKDGFYFSGSNGTFSIKWVRKKYTFVYGNRTDHIFSLDPHFRLLDSSLKNSSQIRVLSEVAQPQWPDQCKYHRCEQGCVVISNHQHHGDKQHHYHHQHNTTCVCRYGYELRADGRTCEERGYLIYSSGTTFGRISPKGEDNTLLYNDSSANIQTFDVDVDSEYIYWSDLFAQTIYRAPVEQLSRKETVVSDVTAFGLTVDWVHGHVYWTDHSRILLVAPGQGTSVLAPGQGTSVVAPGQGSTPVVVLDGLDSPANMAVDPIDKYIFWVECGEYLSIKRAGLAGSDVTILISDQVTCGMSLTADHVTSTLFILDWAGAVSMVRYDGTGHTRLYSDVVRGVTVMDHQPLWTVIEYSEDAPEDDEAFFKDQLNVLAHDLQPAMVKVMKRSVQPEGVDTCAEVECRGVCLPRASGSPMCVCPGNGDKMTHCPEDSKKDRGRSPNDYLELVEVTPFSITLRFTGPLVKHKKIRPYVHVEEMASLVPRRSALRRSDYVHVDHLDLPFTIDAINPATTYQLTVQHGVTRASHSLTVHTPPPPLAVHRLPLVTVPNIPGNLLWDKQGIHYAGENPWEPLVSRKYFLLLLSHVEYTQSDPPAVPDDILDLLRRQVSSSSFMVLKTYKSEAEFDDDPEMFLANILWGVPFQLAMVQAIEYRGSLHLDIVYSRRFSLPDPFWKPFAEEVLEEQEVIDSVERI